MIKDDDFFIEEAKLFAESEMSKEKDYFKPELCGVKQLLERVVDFYTQKPKSSTSLYHGEELKIETAEKLVKFF